MPTICYPDPNESSQWRSLRITQPIALPCVAVAEEHDPVAVLPSGALICRSDKSVRVNGRPVLASIRVLSDRDEIRLANKRLYFVSQDPLFIELYEGEPLNCPRCSDVIASGSEVIRCHCGTLFHQSADHPCLTYGETCPTCGASSRLDGDAWDPSEL